MHPVLRGHRLGYPVHRVLASRGKVGGWIEERRIGCRDFVVYSLKVGVGEGWVSEGRVEERQRGLLHTYIHTVDGIHTVVVCSRRW